MQELAQCACLMTTVITVQMTHLTTSTMCTCLTTRDVRDFNFLNAARVRFGLIYTLKYGWSRAGFGRKLLHLCKHRFPTISVHATTYIMILLILHHTTSRTITRILTPVNMYNPNSVSNPKLCGMSWHDILI